MYEARSEIILPIQGTYDIVQGRNTIRTLVGLRRWPVTFKARVATAFTALGELVLLIGASIVTPIYLEILEQERNRGVMLKCTFELSADTPTQLDSWCEQLEATADKLDVETKTTQITLKVYLYF